MRYKGIIIFLFSITSCTGGTKPSNNESPVPDINTIYSVKVTSVENERFGYQIFKNDTLLIDQYHIPAVSGTLGFETSYQARSVGELVVNKLVKGQFPPEVNVEELRDLGISY